MAGMALREFACSLCGQKFEKYSGDLMIPGPEICDNCLHDVWQMDETTLASHVRLCLEQQKRQVALQDMVQHIQWFKQTFENAEGAIRARKKLFGF